MSQIRCPYCGSVQVKAMANQPKKYPRPTDPIALADWQKGYDCKKCGNDFIAMPLQPSEPKKPLGFLVKLFKWVFILVIAFMALAYFMGDDKPQKKETPKEQTKEVSEPEQKESILHDVFSEDAEKAAHENIPTEEDYKNHESIQNSTDQNDTLSIKTTLREKDQ